MKFGNIGRSIFRRSKFGPSPEIIDLYQWANMRIGKIASSTRHLKNEQFQHCLIFVLQIEKNLEIC